jgi:hypothetical protein
MKLCLFSEKKDKTVDHRIKQNTETEKDTYCTYWEKAHIQNLDLNKRYDIRIITIKEQLKWAWNTGNSDTTLDHKRLIQILATNSNDSKTLFYELMIVSQHWQNQSWKDL